MNTHLRLLFAILLYSSCTQASAAAAPGLNDRPENLTCVAPERPATNASVTLQEVIPGLRGLKPIDMKPIPGDPDRFVVSLNNGIVDLYQRNPSDEQDTEFEKIGNFLDITEDVVQKWNDVYAVEMGFFGVAFHPDFQSNGYAYVYYSAFGSEPGSAYEGRLSRFISTDGGLTLDRDSEESIMKIDHSLRNNHWGGAMMFDANGLFYFTLGDATDKLKAQDPNSLLGKILRLDLDTDFPYGIPADNPYSVSGGRPEVYALGFRNPWRANIDAVTGDLWVGDVGFTEWEEVDLVEKGGNYGWPYLEGTHCTTFYNTCEVENAIAPVIEYDHNGSGKAIIGGYVYRGTALPELYGVYIFGDAVTGEIWALNYDEKGNSTKTLLVTSSDGIFSFAQDSEGEIYSIGRRSVSKLAPNNEEEPSTFPKLLSETGCVNPDDPTQPATGLIPYIVNSPIWSDNAEKQRWIALPDWKSGPSEITINAQDDWEFPGGTVLVKSFAVADALVETRLFIHHEDGAWAGYTYQWREDQSDAELLDSAKTIDLANQTWTFPSQAECMQCHTEAAGFSIGPETAQLNGEYTYQATDVHANQLATLAHIGVFSDDLSDTPENLPALITPNDPDSLDLESQVRAYLHGNCSMCHQPGGLGRGDMDLRYSVSLDATGLINAEPTQGNLNIENAKIIKPGIPEESVLLKRLRSLNDDRMPPLATAIVDTAGTQLIENWIISLDDGEPIETVEVDSTDPLEPETASEAIDTQEPEIQAAERIVRVGTFGGTALEWLLLGLSLLIFGGYQNRQSRPSPGN